MQFTTSLLTLTLAIAGATAAPSAVEERQTTIGLFFIQFFTEDNCQGTMIDSHAFVDLNESSNECQAAPERVRSYPSFRVRQTNDLTRPVFLTKNPDCSTDNKEAPLVIQPTVPIFTCFTQKVGGAFFGDE